MIIMPNTILNMKIPFLTGDLNPELALRVEKVRQQMKKDGLDAILLGSTVNIFYMSGCIFRGYIYLGIDREPLFFLIPPSVPDAGQKGCLAVRKPEMIAAALEADGYGLPARLGLEYADLPYSEVERLKACFPEAKISDASAALRRARMVKTDYEIIKMKEDGMKQAAAYSKVSRCYREDMTDLEFQIEIERVLRLEGCLGILRTAGNRMELNLGSVINGENADTPSPYDFAMGGEGTDPSLPVGANGVTMRPGTTVMVDMNGGFNGYQTDMTRTWAIGEVNALAAKAHECSRAILRRLEQDGKAGISVASLYNTAAEMAKEEGLHSYFMGHRNKAAFIGHGVGIELNEQPVVMERSRDTLQENMTIALEPKFVIPHVGAVGVENTYRVTASGLENLTVFPEELSEL